MALTSVALCNRALTLLGEAPITSLEEESAPSQIANTIYEMVLDSALAAHPWRFATKEAVLSKLTDAPVDKSWAHQYLLPGDYISVHSVGRSPGFSGNLAAYQIFGDRIYANTADGLVVEYVARPPESEFPPHFTKYLVYQLASDMAIAITENVDKWDVFRRLAERESALAHHIDSRQTPSMGFGELAAGLISGR